MNMGGKRVLVFGADGHLGSYLTSYFDGLGAKVFPSFRIPRSEANVGSVVYRLWNTHKLVVDVTHYQAVRNAFYIADQLDVVVYAVGHYPASGVVLAASRPMSMVKPDQIDQEMLMHVYGLTNVLQRLVERSTGSKPCHLVVVGSAITKLAATGTLPPQIQSADYLIANGAKDMLIAAARMDPAIKSAGILVHSVKFGGLDTPFFDGAARPLVPPGLVPLDTAAETIAALIQTNSPQTAILSAEGIQPD